MPLKPDQNTNTYFPFPLLVMLALCIALVASLTAYNNWDRSYIQNDGVQYLSTAKNIVNGQGVATDTLAFGPHFQGRIPGPQTMWPPGYPALIALVASFSGDFERAALSVNIFFLFIGAVLVSLLLARCGLPRSWALLGAGLFYLTYFQWTFVAGLLSEPVFCSAILASLCVLPDIRRSGLARYLICGIFLAVILLIRHSAVIFIAGVGLAVFCLLCLELTKKAESVKAAFTKCMLLGGPSVLLFAGLMLRVRLTTNSAIEVHGTHSPENLYHFLSTVFSELGWFLGFYVYGNGIPVFVGKILAVVFIALAFAWGALSLLRGFKSAKAATGPNIEITHGNDFEQHISRDFRTVLFAVVIFHTVLFFLYFAYCMMTDVPLRFSRRYFFQIHSGLLLTFLVIIYSGSQDRLKLLALRKPPSSRFNVGFGLTLFVLFAIAQIHGITSVSLVQERNREMLRMLDFPLQVALGPKQNNNTVRQLVDACFKTESAEPANVNLVQREEGVIWSDQGQILHQYLRVPTIALANRYRESAVDFEYLGREIETYNIRMLVMVPFWALENAWKIPLILEWAAAEQLPVMEVSGYDDDPSRNTFVVFVDPACAPAV